MTSPSAEKPIPEHMAGTVFALRGQEQHGVPMSGEPDLQDAWSADGDDLVVEIPPDPEPIPVKIVQAETRQLRRFRTFHVFVRQGESAVQILTKDPARVSARIVNLSVAAADFVWISGEQNTASFVHGYPLFPSALAARSELVLSTDEAVYAGPGVVQVNPVELAVMVEYVVNEH